MSGTGGIPGMGGLALGTGGMAGSGGFGGGGLGGMVGGIDALSPIDGRLVDAAIAMDTGARNDGNDVSLDSVTDSSIALDVTADSAILTCGPFPNDRPSLDAGGSPSSAISFFVSSQTSTTGNLGGLAAADARCQRLAQAAGVPSPNWRAYLSVEHNPVVTGPAVNARDRIGRGPWYNARGALVATDVMNLHTRKGDASVFLDERGELINGQWTGSPSPVEHDILTGSNPDGTVALGKTCDDWTSDAGAPDGGGGVDGGGGWVARVGHSDGLGPQCSTSGSPIDYTSWNSSHDNAGCNNTGPLGGAGRIYCFLAN